MDKEENPTDCLIIEYRRGSRLYVPMYDFKKVQKYIGAGGKRPTLSVLGGTTWKDVKNRVKEEAQKAASGKMLPGALEEEFQVDEGRRVLKRNRIFDNPRTKIRTNGMNGLSVDHKEIDLRLVEQLVDEEQVTALGAILRYAYKKLANDKLTMQQILDQIEALLDAKGLEALGSRGLARPRRLEIAACLNRFRMLQ